MSTKALHPILFCQFCQTWYSLIYDATLTILGVLFLNLINAYTCLHNISEYSTCLNSIIAELRILIIINDLRIRKWLLHESVFIRLSYSGLHWSIGIHLNKLLFYLLDMLVLLHEISFCNKMLVWKRLIISLVSGWLTSQQTIGSGLEDGVGEQHCSGNLNCKMRVIVFVQQIMKKPEDVEMNLMF